MKIRWKLLLVLLSISLIPMILMRWYNQRGMRGLGEELAARTQNVLIQKANFELKILVDEHASILQRDRALIDLALKVQAAEIEKRFFSETRQNIQQAPIESLERKVFQSSRKHLRVMGRRSIPLYVSYDMMSDLNSSRAVKGNPAKYERLSSMVPAFRSLADAHSEHILWQITVFEDGSQALYPAVKRYPMGYNAYQEEWYQNARNVKQTFWSRPIIDPFTRQLSFVASFPLFGPDGKFFGATAIVVPVGTILHVDEHIQALSKKVTALLVKAEHSPAVNTLAIRIVAHEHELRQRHRHWRAAQSDEWLISDDGKSINSLIKALSEHQNGVAEISYKSKESLAAYGNIDKFGLALMLIISKEDIVAEADSMRRYVLDRIAQQINITLIILIAVFLFVVCLAFFLSRSVTENIQKLVHAVRQVASGNFKIRTRIQSQGEIGELGRAFDRMIPALEERIEIKQALDLAMQVQKNLLPQSMPVIDGLDIAARSIYCDETGGDFYDFMDLPYREPEVTGIAVGDVSGHGISAALLMASARAFLRSGVTRPGNMGEIINVVNRLLTKDVKESGQFVTLFYMEINPIKKEIEWIRAGHDPAMIYTPASSSFEALRGEGILMGADGNYDFEPNVKTGLTSGQIVLIGTDGIWETHNVTGEMFGKQRLEDIIRMNSKLPAGDILETILRELENFRGDFKQEDDVTLVVIKVE